MLSSCHREGQSIHSCLFRDSQPPGIPSKALNRGHILSQESGGGGEKERECRRSELSRLHNSSKRVAFMCVRYVALLKGEKPACVSNFVLYKGPASSWLFRNIKTLTGRGALRAAPEPLEALCPWSDSKRGSVLTPVSCFWCHICALKPRCCVQNCCQSSLPKCPKGGFIVKRSARDFFSKPVGYWFITSPLEFAVSTRATPHLGVVLAPY